MFLPDAAPLYGIVEYDICRKASSRTLARRWSSIIFAVNDVHQLVSTTYRFKINGLVKLLPWVLPRTDLALQRYETSLRTIELTPARDLVHPFV